MLLFDLFLDLFHNLFSYHIDVGSSSKSTDRVDKAHLFELRI